MIDKAAFLNELEEVVNIDSGTYYKKGVDAVGEWFADRYASMGWDIEWYEPDGELGKSFTAYNADHDDIDVLVMCHLDTVFPEGEVAKRPFSIEGDFCYGPGVADMKSGCVFLLHVLRELHAEQGLKKKYAVFFNGEEEIGSLHTRPIIEELSRKSKFAFAVEPARANGAFLNQRKGSSRYFIEFHGKAAHSGNNPEEGICAVTEAANWILFFKSMVDNEKGVYLNPGVVKGGTSVNSIPDFAEMKVDVRFIRQEDGEEVHDKIMKKLKTGFDEKVKIDLKGGITRPPMMPNDKTEEICEKIDELGRQNGVEVKWVFAGGGSDASFPSAFGVPSLCGMGLPGGKSHSAEEFLDLRQFEERFKLLKDILLM
ncbi:peptidase M20 [Denitrovibrio acetiphilus DSM 12809]|uniref:Peptidase M20 n=1 Tax=Denitrovibrio acetiphilus (strain DSM 12809 / NBRC 114555 / N2460) TaxID=522772 RepID=D4H3U2_DENA2|nr:M20 family metallopeptidase [Denitrovibrio acetiphilus]ADD69194.1 peptidase M20 [Denitrovibrio acetiphilus DSM 12809]